MKRMKELIEVCIEDAARLGYGEYRTHIGSGIFESSEFSWLICCLDAAFLDQIAGNYNWNNNAIGKLNETIKDALDPNGILAPGKSGIWPARYRKKGKAV